MSRGPRTRTRVRYRIPEFSRGTGGQGAIRISLDVSGWMRKSRRLVRALKELPRIRLSYKGNHSVLNQSNQRIAKHAIAHGDDIWMFSDETKKAMATELRDGVVRVARNQQKDLRREMQELADMAREEVYYNIWDAKIAGPARRPEWIAYKSARWGNSQNMVASGEWLNSLTAELV